MPRRERLDYRNNTTTTEAPPSLLGPDSAIGARGYSGGLPDANAPCDTAVYARSAVVIFVQRLQEAGRLLYSDHH